MPVQDQVPGTPLHTDASILKLVAAHLVPAGTSWLSQRPSLPDKELLLLRRIGREPLLLTLCSNCWNSSASSAGATVLEERRDSRHVRL